MNGFKFHNLEYDLNRTTVNGGVCILESCFNDYERDYYVMLLEVWEIEYFGPQNRVVLFKGDWFDSENGIHVHP